MTSLRLLLVVEFLRRPVDSVWATSATTFVENDFEKLRQ